MRRLLPEGVATAECRADLASAVLFPAEERVIARAAPRRRAEFATARACARDALGQLGIAPRAIPVGEQGEPLWPDGVIGSITHCDGYRAAAVARADELLCVGIDAEVNAPLRERVSARIGSALELARARAAAPEASAGRLVFSAKEAAFKAWRPLGADALSLRTIEILVETGGEVRASTTAASGVRPRELRGRWDLADGVIRVAFAEPRALGGAGRASAMHEVALRLDPPALG